MKKLAAIVAMFAATSAFADPDGYFMFAVLNPGQLPTQTSVIYGGRFSAIFGACQRIYGIDAGVAGRTFEDAYGVQAGGLNIVDLDAAGLQLGFLGNYVAVDFAGLQAGVYNSVRGATCGAEFGVLSFSNELEGLQAGVYGRAAEFDGLQANLLNVAGSGNGLQIGALNASGARFGRFESAEAYLGDFNGAQIGVVNKAASVHGVQIGVVNCAAELRGLQIGILNYIGDDGPLNVLPVANWRF